VIALLSADPAGVRKACGLLMKHASPATHPSFTHGHKRGIFLREKTKVKRGYSSER